MIEADTTNTVKCASCGTAVPVAALLCPGCGRPNVSSAFASTGASFLSRATEAPPANIPPGETPPVGGAPPTSDAVNPTFPPISFVAAPQDPARQSISPQPTWKPAAGHIVMVYDLLAERTRDKIQNLDLEWFDFTENSRVKRWDGRRTSPPQTKDALRMLLWAGGASLLGCLIVAAGGLWGLMVGVIIILGSFFVTVVALDYYSHANKYRRAYNRYLEARQELLDRLDWLEGQS